MRPNLATAMRKPRIFYGWYIVAAAAAINMYGAGVWFYGFPIFYTALLDEFGWTAALAAGAFSISRLEGGLEGPIVGWLVDRYGPRKLAIIGAVVAGTGFMAMSRMSQDGYTIGPFHISALVAFYLLYAGWISVGYNTGFGHASMAAVNAWFSRKRSRAFGFFSLGAGGSGLTVILLGWAVSTYGWRTAAFLSGVGILIIVIPLAFVLRHKPEQYGQLPDGDHVGLQDAGPFGTGIIGVEAGPTASVEQRLRATRTEWPEYDFSVRETLRTFAFWMLVLGTGARSVAMTSIVLHEVNYLTQVRDIPLVQASLALGMMVTVSIVGRFGFGWLGDYVDKRYLMITTFLLQAVGIYLLTNATTMPQVWLFVVVYGIAYGGGIPIFMAMIGEYFGRMNFATIRGFMQLFHIPTTVFGPVFAGLVYDATGSYEIAFTSFIIALVVGAAFLVLARRPLPPTRAEAIGGNSE